MIASKKKKIETNGRQLAHYTAKDKERLRDRAKLRYNKRKSIQHSSQYCSLWCSKKKAEL